MVPSFNTAGPCIPGEHYMLPPGARLGRVMQLIEEKKYFTLYAGHQTGKTTCAAWLVDHYNTGDRYFCILVDLQTAREEPDLQKAMRTVLMFLDHAVSRDLAGVTPPAWPAEFNPATAVVQYLRELCARAPRPLVVLFDEADGLIGRPMVSFLTQLRSGYLDRAKVRFPDSVVLMGRRQVRDDVLNQEDRRVLSWLGTSSPFNITAEAQTLAAFSRDDVAALLQQHTEHTGQPFLPEAVEHIYFLSQGHPWVVNALADQIVRRDVTDRAVAVTRAHVEAAKETIILERRSHIDALIARLREERVVRIIEPMLTGEEMPQYDTLHDDFAYVLGLGLLAKRGGQYQIANPIYKEVIPRVLSYDRQMVTNQQTEWYLTAAGGLDMGKLFRAWQEYWREDGHVAAQGFRYREAGPHLLLMAFLQRIVNGGGRIDREYGLGRKALDLLLTWPLPGGGVERHAIEVKLRRDRTTEGKGVKQLCGYLEALGLTEGWLVLFDLRKGRSWRERIFTRTRRAGGYRIRIIGC
jgi:hypothetical protein